MYANNPNGTMQKYAEDPGAEDITRAARTISDKGTPIASVTYNRTPVHDGPVAGREVFALTENSAISGKLLDRDAGDVTLSILTADSNLAPFRTAQGGALFLQADGGFAYRPAAGFNGADSFVYTVQDGACRTATATVAFIVTPATDGPASTVTRAAAPRGCHFYRRAAA